MLGTALGLGCFALFAGLFGWLSGEKHALKFAGLMGLSWALSNLELIAFGFDGAGGIIAMTDAVISLGVAAIAADAKSRLGLLIFALFWIEMIVHYIAHEDGMQASRAYWGALDAIYILQCVSVGVWSAFKTFAHWTFQFDHGIRIGLSRRSNLVAKVDAPPKPTR